LSDAAEQEEGLEFLPRFGADGLLTCVTIDAHDGAVLMVIPVLLGTDLLAPPPQ